MVRVPDLAPVVARRLLQFELELWCERAGVKHGDLGKRLCVSRAAVSQVIAGASLPSQAVLEVMLAYFDAVERLPVLTEVLRFARTERRIRGSIDYEGGSGWVVRDGALIVGLEAVATSIDVFDATVVTPLLSTTTYSHSLARFSNGRTSLGDGRLWERRRDAETPGDVDARLSWIVQEQVLRDVAARVSDQLTYLVEVSHRPDVSLRVVPAGEFVPAGLRGGFQIYRSPAWTVACQETATRAHHFTDAATVADYEAALADLRLTALDEEQSRALFAELAAAQVDATTRNPPTKSSLCRPGVVPFATGRRNADAAV